MVLFISPYALIKNVGRWRHIFIGICDHLHEMMKEYERFHQQKANVDETLSDRKVSAAKPPSAPHE